MAYNTNNKFNTGKKDQKPARPANVEFVIPVSDQAVTANGRSYDFDSLCDIIDVLVGDAIFEKISIPLYCSRNIIDKENAKPGFSIVGYIRGFVDGCLKVEVYHNLADHVKDLGDNALVVPRVQLSKENKVRTIIAFDVMDARTFNIPK